MNRKRTGTLILLIVALLIVVTDRVSKAFVLAQLDPGETLHIAPWLSPILQFTYVTNTGAAFGFLPQFGTIFAIFSAIVIVAIVIYTHQLPSDEWLMRLSLGLMLGGALGNLIDRLWYGHVVDFVDLNFWPLHEWPVFNVADSSIVVGVTILMILMIWEEIEESRQAQAQVVEDA